jgi:hypothetical protein
VDVLGTAGAPGSPALPGGLPVDLPTVLPAGPPAASVGAVVETVVDTALAVATEQPAVLLAGLAALVAVVWSVSWRLTRTVVTIAHEGGHALTAVLAGRGLTGIRLHADTSGLTVSTGAGRGPGLVLTFLAGYPAPSLLGLGGALLVASGRSELLLWLTLGLLAATLVHVRNLFGVVAVVGTGAVVAVAAIWGEPALRVGFATALCWFLLFGGWRAVRELQRGRRRRSSGESDADALARLTGVPGGLWAGLFWVLATASAGAGTWVLLF